MVCSSTRLDWLRSSLSRPTISTSPVSPSSSPAVITASMRSIGIWKASTPSTSPWALATWVATKAAGAPLLGS